MNTDTKIYMKKYFDELEPVLYGLRQALPVPPITDDFDPTQPPTTGEEYLQHVLYEKRDLPKVVCAERGPGQANVAECGSKLFEVKPGVVPSPFPPDEAWEQQQVDKFEKVRRKMHKLKLSGEVTAEVSFPQLWENNTSWRSMLKSTQPLITVVLPQHQAVLEKIISLLVDVKPGDMLWECHGSWFYAVCACLEHPLSSDAYSDLRDIARKCSQLRQFKEDPEDEELLSLNLIITLVVKYFRQYDLCE